MSATIFISYRRKDALKDARAMFERLRADFGEQAVYIDIDGTDLGTDFHDTLERQLAQCQVVLALIGPQWLGALDSQGRRRLDNPDDFVRIELRTALARPGVRVVPVLIDDTEMPQSAELPPDLDQLPRRQALSLRFANFDADMRHLTVALRRMLQPPSAVPTALSPAVPPEVPTQAPVPAAAAPPVPSPMTAPAPRPAPPSPVPPAADQPPLAPLAPVQPPLAGPARQAPAADRPASVPMRRALIVGGASAAVAGGVMLLWPKAPAPPAPQPAAQPAPLAANNSRPAWATAQGQDAAGRWAECRIGPVVQRLRWIAPGEFWMGSPDNEPERFPEEGPRHRVRLTDGFWLADSACTQALWLAVLGGTNPSHFKNDANNPVEKVSWDDAQRFLQALQGQLAPGTQAVLPTEAQWEYACRAGTETPFSFGQTVTPAQANFDGNQPYNGGPKGLSRGGTVPVKSLPANAWGLHEMHGNVWEWCADGTQTTGQLRAYSAAPADRPAVNPAQPPGQGPEALRAARGGSWLHPAHGARSAVRDAYQRRHADGFLGFRLALMSPGP